MKSRNSHVHAQTPGGNGEWWESLGKYGVLVDEKGKATPVECRYINKRRAGLFCFFSHNIHEVVRAARIIRNMPDDVTWCC